MNKITATFRIVTPMFISGADQSRAELRAPSIKGALRFWWRALNWGRYRNQPGSDDASALRKLHKEEARLFGATADEAGRGGQGCFLLRVFHDPLKRTNKPDVHPEFKNYTAARYLGYGLMVAFRSTNRHTGETKEAGQLERSCLNEDQKFTVELIFRKAVEPAVKESLIAWGLLGGLGSRSRHGMGNVALLTLEDEKGSKLWTAPDSIDEYESKIRELFSDISFPSCEPPFSAFWEESRVDRLLSANSPYKVLDDFGSKMLDYRSWGRTLEDGTRLPLPSGRLSEERFKDDHDWFRESGWASSNPNFHPLRAVFGLPHNYHKNHHHVTSEHYERRSSPLLFHVHPVGDEFVGISIYLPARFLPSDEKIKADGKLVPANIEQSGAGGSAACSGGIRRGGTNGIDALDAELSPVVPQSKGSPQVLEGGVADRELLDGGAEKSELTFKGMIFGIAALFVQGGKKNEGLWPGVAGRRGLESLPRAVTGRSRFEQQPIPGWSHPPQSMTKTAMKGRALVCRQNDFTDRHHPKTVSGDG